MADDDKSLSKQISDLKDQHAEETFERRKADQEQSEQSEAMYFLGRIKQTGHLATAIANNLLAQEIRALEQFQKMKMFKSLGFATHDEFLDNSPYAPVTKRQYYDRLALVRKHGDEIYDLLTSIGISVRTQKQLGSGDLTIKNDTLYVGEREVEIADVGIVKEVLNELFEEKRELLAEKEALAKSVEKQKATIQRGVTEFDELRRNFDALTEGTPFERALMSAIAAMLDLVNEVKKLPEGERKARGEADVKTFTEQWFRLRDAYGVSFALAANTPAMAGEYKPVEEMSDEEKEATFFERHKDVLTDDDLGDDL